jgi:hypothetical protein
VSISVRGGGAHDDELVPGAPNTGGVPFALRLLLDAVRWEPTLSEAPVVPGQIRDLARHGTDALREVTEEAPTALRLQLFEVVGRDRDSLRKPRVVVTPQLVGALLCDDRI